MVNVQMSFRALEGARNLRSRDSRFLVAKSAPRNDIDTRAAREARYAARDVTDKLGLKPGHAVRVIGKAERTLVAKVRAKIGCAFVSEKERADVILYWAASDTEIAAMLKKLKRAIVPNGGIWVITFKKGKGEPYVLDRALIGAGLKAGLVDNKICSVSETQSAMRFVIRIGDRVQKSEVRQNYSPRPLRTRRSKMNYDQVIKLLRSKRNPRNIAGMARFGINPKNTLGISVVELRKLGKQIGTDHALALKLWASGIHEARILASIVDEPARFTLGQMERWVKQFDSWDVCDQVCINLFDKTRYAHAKAAAWSKREHEFEKRAGFALMAVLAVHDRDARDAAFEEFLPLIVRGARDERNFVKKAVNWALRQIGKRNARLNRAAIRTAREIAQLDSKSARWVAADALRELTSSTVQKKLAR